MLVGPPDYAAPLPVNPFGYKVLGVEVVLNVAKRPRAVALQGGEPNGNRIAEEPDQGYKLGLQAMVSLARGEGDLSFKLFSGIRQGVSYLIL